MTDKPEPLISTDQLSHIVIYVRDLGRSVAFYRQVLGFEVLRDDRVGAAENAAQKITGRLANTAVELIQSEKDVVDAAATRQRREPGYGILAFSVPDVETALATLRQHALTRFPSVISTPAGHKVILFRDPDGNVIELIQLRTGRTLLDSMVGTST